MKLQYLGTAAAEAIPALFCRCDTCMRARANGGKDIRGRSGAILDDQLMIDFPPDIYMHTMRFGLDLAKVTDLVVTHSHMDHFCALELMLASSDYYAHNGPEHITVYGNSNVGNALRQGMFTEYKTAMDFVSYRRIAAFTPFEVCGFTVTPLPAVHAKSDATEDPFIYLVQKNGKTLLYANDTGIFYDEVFAYLQAHAGVIDLVSFDCTCGRMKEGTNHMGIADNLLVKQRLEQQGNIGPNTRCVITHFSHNGVSTHAELEQEVAKYGFIVAYDGMTVEV